MAKKEVGHYHQAAEVLCQGGIIAYPTEAVWGLGCNPFNQPAIKRLLKLKKRAANLGLILVAYDIKQLVPLMMSLTPQQLDQLQSTWPGATTWVVPHCGRLAKQITGGRPTVALRVSAHEPVRELCRHFNAPIVSTSANIHGQKPPRTLAETHSIFADQVDYYLPGNTAGAIRPTEIKDLMSGEIIRNG